MTEDVRDERPASVPLRYAMGSDIGGTFTDAIVYDRESGELRIAKTPTTPNDPAEGVFRGLESLRSALPGATRENSRVTHATTLVGNAVIERRGVKVGLLCTAGFRDILEMRRHQRVSPYELWNDPPEALVPRKWRVPVQERIWSDGSVLTALDDDQVQAAVEYLQSEAVESIAVALLHAYVNPKHELRVAELIESVWPEVSVSLSSDVLAQVGEFERTLATVLNAYTKPLVRHYLTRLEEELDPSPRRGRLHLLLSNGGVASVKTSARYPIRLVESGPVAGAVAALAIGQATGSEEVLAFDMGGTTAKACVIRSGSLPLTFEQEVARAARFEKGSGYPIGIPAVDLIEIGAGGGSIAHVNALGVLEVGPHSSGARPGPACYGHGGLDPTVTDSDLQLGYLNPNYFLGGAMALDLAAASASMERLARGAGKDPDAVAWAIHDVVNERMAGAIRMHAAERGADLREFSMLAFGGAGPVHAYNLARKVGVSTVVIPPGAGVMSALGLLMAQPSFDLTRTYRVPFTDLDPDSLRHQFDAMEKEVAAHLRLVDEDAKTRFAWSIDCSYIGQGYSISLEDVEFDPGLQAEELRMYLSAKFADLYTKQYGRYYEDVPLGMVGLHVKGTLDTQPLEARRLAKASRPAQHRANLLGNERRAYSPELGGFVTFKVFDRYILEEPIEGPAIIEERESTTIVDVGGRVTVDDMGNLVLAVG